MKRVGTIAELTVLGVLLAAPGAASAQAAEGADESRLEIRLDDVLSLAERRSPRLSAVRFAATAAGAREAEASTLPDPMLQLGIMNFGLPDLNADMPTSMAPSLQVTQLVPFPGKLSLRGRIAEQGTAMAEATAQESLWEIRREAAGIFFDLYALDRRLEVMRETLALLRDFQEVAKAMYVSGTGRQTDVLRSDVEVARMDGEIRRMEAMRTAKTSQLNALLDRPASTSVPTPVLGALPLEVPTADTLRAWALESRPLLDRRRRGLDQARLRTDLAQKQIWPDFMVGVAYGQRDRGFGTERMGSAMIGFSLPVHAGSRQLAARTEAAALEDMADAELTNATALVDGGIEILLAELERARRLTDLYRDEIVPEARAMVESAFSSYRVGAVDFMTLVDAQMTANQYEGELFQLLAEYGKAVTALESAIGRELPRTGPLLREQR